jgi:DNA-binding transcriptional ArsR family regulator
MSSVTAELDRAFAALADPHRRDILDRLSRGPIAASQLAKPLGMTVTGVLKHLHALEDAKLVTTHKVGRTRLCQLTPEALDTPATWIAERRRVWNRRFDRFQAHLEQHRALTREL